MRFRLRTLMIVLVLVPPAMAWHVPKGVSRLFKIQRFWRPRQSNGILSSLAKDVLPFTVTSESSRRISARSDCSPLASSMAAFALRFFLVVDGCERLVVVFGRVTKKKRRNFWRAPRLGWQPLTVMTWSPSICPQGEELSAIWRAQARQSIIEPCRR
jgi:hypothetical protein